MHRSSLRTLVCALFLLAAPAAGASSDPAVRVATFNIHHGAGTDDRLDLERAARTIEATGAEVIGLQEVDNHWGERSAFADQAAELGRRLDMHVAYGANLDLDGEPRRQYGTAMLSKWRIRDARNTLLPGHGAASNEGCSRR